MDEVYKVLNLTEFIDCVAVCLSGLWFYIAHEVIRFLALNACGETTHSVTHQITSLLNCKLNSCKIKSHMPIIAGDALDFMSGVEDAIITPYFASWFFHKLVPLSQI